jgi:hypothetical protein
MLEAITYTSSWDIRIIKVYPVNSVHYTIYLKKFGLAFQLYYFVHSLLSK